MKKLYICGCSHSTGYYSTKNNKPIQSGFNNPYTKLIAEKLSMHPVMLAQAGASNYFIIKQIEYAIEPDKIHLSQHGHQMVADYLIEQVNTAFSI